MGLWDVEEDIDDEIFPEDALEDEDVPEEGNRYLSDSNAALELVARVLPNSTGNYSKRKGIQKIDDMLDIDFLSALKRIQLTNEAQLQMKLALLSDKLAEQEKYKVLKNKAVIGLGGKFSAGKSKFINSILKAGEELLPEDQNPTTSIPTYIVYGDREEISAYTSNSERVTLDVEALQALTHKFYEKYGMGFSAFVNSLIISEPDMPYHDLVFLDTPGYSKADAVGTGKKQKELSDENKAYVQLRNVDYLIWLMDIENGVISAPDIAFISKLGIETPILIVANKADKMIDEDIEKIVELVRITAQNAGLNVFGVTAYSSRCHKEWGNANMISSFFNMAERKRTGKDDILAQIEVIKKRVQKEIIQKIDNKVEERNSLNDIIFRSNDIMEIRSLVALYGESMEEIRDMKAAQRKYQANARKLERALEKQYGRRQ